MTGRRVSGRPQLIGDRLGQIDALVASWLPGAEGAGVADVLYGRRPFTGRLPVTWPRPEARLPINVGDTSYDPQYPYGWGLTTLTKVPDGGAGTLRALATAAAAAERAGADRTGPDASWSARLIVQRKVGQHITAEVAKALRRRRPPVADRPVRGGRAAPGGGLASRRLSECAPLGGFRGFG